METMKTKTVLITGPTSGIGREIAKGLAKIGANLVLGCRNVAAGKALSSELGQASSVDVLEVDLVESEAPSRSSLVRFSKGIPVWTWWSTTPG